MSDASDADSVQEDYPEDPGSGSEDSERESGESESGDDAGGLLDLEASESDGDEDSSDADPGSDGSDAQADELLDGTTAVGFWDGLDFPQFSRLPPELRARVWECFCSMVLQRPRVLDFEIVPGPGYPVPYCKAVPGPLLAREMESVCAMLAVNHESRAIALRAFPDKLAVYGPGGSTVRFDKSSDVVRVSFPRVEPIFPAACTISGFSEHVEHLALECPDLSFQTDPLEFMQLCFFLDAFENLRTVYEAADGDYLPSRKIHWCGSSDAVHIYHVDHAEVDEAGIEHYIPQWVVWPDLERHRDFAMTAICPEVRTVGTVVPIFDEVVDDDEEFDQRRRLRDVEVWPMIRFWGRAGREQLEELRKTEFDDLTDGEDSFGADDFSHMVDDDEDEDDGSDMEDFIDDESHDEVSLHSNSDSEDDLMANGLDAHEYDAEGGVHLGGAAGVDDGDEETAYNQSFNGFSPIEPDSDVDPGQGASLNATGTAVDDEEGEDQGRPRPGKRARSRQVVSDDEEEEEARPAKRSKRRPVVTSDSEGDGPSATREEGRAKKRAKTRRSRAVISDDEDEEEDGDPEEVEPVHRHRRTRAVQVASESESDEEEGESETSPSDSGKDEEEDEDEDEEDGGSRPLTLAEKLGMHRRANPVSSDDEEVASSDADQRRGDYGENYEDEDEEDDYGGNDNPVDRYGEEPESEGEPGSDEEDGW